MVGRPLGVVAAVWLGTRPLLGDARRALSWPAIVGGGAVAGIGFTVALLIASPAFQGRRLEHQDELPPTDLRRHASDLALDLERFDEELRRRERAPRIIRDVETADSSGVAGTPTFFINGVRCGGAYDRDSLGRAVERARWRARLEAVAEGVSES